MEINDYVRTKDYPHYRTKIAKIDGGSVGKWHLDDEEPHCIIGEESITKHSKDIIDLVEVGDYVNGYLVIEVDKTNSSVIIDHKIDEGTYDSFYNDDGWDSRYIEDWVDERLYNYEIKTLLTKQQFEANAYKIEKEK